MNTGLTLEKHVALLANGFTFSELASKGMCLTTYAAFIHPALYALAAAFQ